MRRGEFEEFAGPAKSKEDELLGLMLGFMFESWDKFVDKVTPS